MADSINQVEAHLEALIYLLMGLGFIINIPKSITHSIDRVSGSAGGFYLPTIELTRGETPPHQDRDQSELTEVPGDSMSTGSIN